VAFVFFCSDFLIRCRNFGLLLPGLPPDTLSGHRDRFYAQYRTYVFVAVVISCMNTDIVCIKWDIFILMHASKYGEFNLCGYCSTSVCDSPAGVIS